MKSCCIRVLYYKHTYTQEIFFEFLRLVHMLVPTLLETVLDIGSIVSLHRGKVQEGVLTISSTLFSCRHVDLPVGDTRPRTARACPASCCKPICRSSFA